MEPIGIFRTSSDPIMLRRTYDISAVCCRRGHEKDNPTVIRLQGEAECSLLRAVCIGTAVAAGIAVIRSVGTMAAAAKARRRLKRRYEEKMRSERLRLRCTEKEMQDAETAVKILQKAAKAAKKSGADTQKSEKGRCGGPA